MAFETLPTASQANDASSSYDDTLRTNKFEKTQLFLNTNVKNDIENACKKALYDIKYGIENLKKLYVYKNYENSGNVIEQGSIWYVLTEKDYSLDESDGYLTISWKNIVNNS